MNRSEKMILAIIVLLPVIDIATSFTTDKSFSVGIIVRMGMLTVIFAIFIKNFTRQQLPILILLSSIILTFGINFSLKEPFHFFTESQFLFKTLYLIMIIYLVGQLITTKRTRKSVLVKGSTYTAMIVGITFWLAVITGTANNSYAYTKVGTAGWYFAANELSVIALILLALSLVATQVGHTQHGALGGLLIASILPMIGTKTALFGGILIVTTFTITSILWRKNIHTTLVLTLVLGTLLTSGMIQGKSESTATEQVSNEPTTTENLLSSRDIYFKNTREDYQKASILRKLFGLGYAGDYKTAPKTIEMDVYDFFFSYGIIGLLSALFPSIMILRKLLPPQRSPSYFLLIFTFLLVSGIAFTAGHVLFAPAVMSYVAILLLITGLLTNGESL